MVPAVCVATVAAAPLEVAETMKPAVLKVAEQVLLTAALQLEPPGQHCNALLAVRDTAPKVTATDAPSAPLGKLKVVLAVPALPKLTELAARLAPLVAVDSTAVWPLPVVTGLVHGLELSAQAVSVTVLGTQLTLLTGRANS